MVNQLYVLVEVHVLLILILVLQSIGSKFITTNYIGTSGGGLIAALCTRTNEELKIISTSIS